MGELSLERSLVGHFAPREDPRDALRRRHKLIELIVIAIAAVLCAADGWVAIAAFGRAKESWLRQFLELPDGIPSHDTFGRVFSVLAPAAFESCFRAWVEAIGAVLPGEVIALDGKMLRRSHDRAAGLGALHLVSAWASVTRVVLGQVATEGKSNEITAIPQLLALLQIEGCIVTIDARQAVRPRSPRRSEPLRGDYTSYRHKFAFSEYLKFQREQGIKLLFVRCVCLV